MNRKLNLDLFGFFASFLCAIHCAALPLILSLSALSGLHFLAEPWFEWGMITLSATIAIVSLVPSYQKHHRNLLPIVIVLSGFVLISAGRIVEAESLEVLFTSSGATLVAASHLVNWRLKKQTGRKYQV